jgi:hypothetical protein
VTIYSTGHLVLLAFGIQGHRALGPFQLDVSFRSDRFWMCLSGTPIRPENEAPAVRSLGDRRSESVHGLRVPRERVAAEIAAFNSGLPSL